MTNAFSDGGLTNIAELGCSGDLSSDDGEQEACVDEDCDADEGPARAWSRPSNRPSLICRIVVCPAAPRVLRASGSVLVPDDGCVR